MLRKGNFIPASFALPRTKRPPIQLEAFSISQLCVFFSALPLRSLRLRDIFDFFSLRPYLFTSLLPASRNAPRPAPPTMHRAPHSSSSESVPRLHWRALSATRATRRDPPCPLPRAPRNTPAPPPASRRKTSSIHRPSPSPSPAPAIRTPGWPPPPPPLPVRRKA